MPVLVITNNTTSPSAISEPDTSFSEDLPAGVTSTFTVSQETIDKLEDQLQDLATRVDANGEPEFTVDVQAESDASPLEVSAIADLIRWTGNHVMAGMVVADPTTPPVVAARRVNIASGELMVDGAYFVYAGANDFAGDAEIDRDGVDVSAVDLVADEDVYMHILAVNNASTLEIIFVRGEGVDNTGALSARPLTDTELANAVGVYLAAGADYNGYCELGYVLYAESTGLTDTTTDVKPIPKAYN